MKIDRHKSADVYHTNLTILNPSSSTTTTATAAKNIPSQPPQHPPPKIYNAQPQRSETADELDEYLSDDSLQGKNKVKFNSNQPPIRVINNNNVNGNINNNGNGHRKETLSDYLIPSSLPPHSHPAVIDNSTVVSALTNDTNLHSFTNENSNQINENKIKKKKKKVWKMEPIPVRPYVQVPSNGNGIGNGSVVN